MEPLASAHPREQRFGGRRVATVVVLCVLFSTQVLAQPGLLEHWPLDILVRAWLAYFAEVLACGLAMWILATLAADLGGEDATRRAALAIPALLAGAVLGSALVSLLIDGTDFTRTAGLFFGDAFRWALFGALVFFAHEHACRASRAADAMAAADLARETTEREIIQARLEVLRAQIEPHFLFNTLAHVRRLYEVRPDAGIEMMTSLRRYLEAALPRMRDAGSDLGREVDFVRAYLSIIRVRLKARLAYRIEVPLELNACPVPPMVLITLVENAVKHGIAPCEEGGLIALTARKVDGFLEVEVADTGAGFQASDGSGVGLANIRARLRGLYGSRGRLSLRCNVPRGVVAQVRFPLDTRSAAEVSL